MKKVISLLLVLTTMMYLSACNRSDATSKAEQESREAAETAEKLRETQKYFDELDDLAMQMTSF